MTFLESIEILQCKVCKQHCYVFTLQYLQIISYKDWKILPFFSLEWDKEFCFLQILLWNCHNLCKGIFKHMIPSDNEPKTSQEVQPSKERRRTCLHHLNFAPSPISWIAILWTFQSKSLIYFQNWHHFNNKKIMQMRQKHQLTLEWYTVANNE